ncbi:hypothetical protein BAUCODRAFT_142671 [Baudoinia panamericana UAMH 10762]|uniref:DH domain-containing protein n=1 Tax=Baudoinia panamericana (strain UAMH 10762) TaxID=717646 RepID=M2N0F9_BAUPA|nr:uncharacterized protein BAUCODRAFT_142671 [Baudoinia panamericana UAMH 10762]EMC92080.1 hypothetical protein BAUCODRAFT_142671 [Baudoinia panamericana UAMH 10762]
MPSPNGANKAPARKTPEQKGVDLAQKLARKRSQDFTTKIQGWNQGGAGVVQRQDEVVVILDDDSACALKNAVVLEVTPKSVKTGKAPESAEVDGGDEAPLTPGSPESATAKGSPKLASSARPSKELDLGRKAWVRRKSKPQAEIAEDIKHAGTPKKRVVSDGHWRRDRTAKPETAVTPEKEVTPKPITIKRSVVTVGLKIPPSVQNFYEDIEPAPVKVRPLRKSRSRSRSRSREREVTPDYEDSGVKVYIKRRKRSKTFDEHKASSTSQSSLAAGSSVDKTASSTDITTPAQSPRKQTPPRPATAPKEKASHRSLEAVEEPRHVSQHRAGATPAEAATRAGPTPAGPRVYGSRIEGWLASTQDPFVEKREASDAPEPLQVRRKTPTKPVDTDTNNDRQASSARRQGSRTTLEPVDAERSSRSPDDVSRGSPTLRRHGARRSSQSPVKGRVDRDLDHQPRDAKTETVTDAELRRQMSRRANSRSFPTLGRQLSTIASVDTFQGGRPRGSSDASEHPTIVPEGSVLSRASDGDEPRRQTSLKRRLTKHSDLISVLSLPRGDPGLQPTRRSTRSRRPQAELTTIGDIMNEVTTEELKYQRELRTLVDGVIPVLLTYVLQKTDATGAKRLFSGSSPDGQAVTRPIVEMGVALEKLKAAHKRIPLHDADGLVRWAQNTAGKYAEYLKAWRLGFQDVVVNLAPAQENEGVPRNNNGDMLKGDGERVDVQYLLKRPLVRLKYLTKTFKSIDQLAPSRSAEEMAAKYHELVQEARQRSNDERARLEDEGAANIDPTRARDPRSLAPLAGVTVDPTRSVRARDYYDLELIHSTGQQLMCKTEIILRDDAPDRGDASDILICEVSLAGRWLLFPPIPASNVSARSGDKDGEIIVMVRGLLASGKEWRELMSLRSEDEGAVTEWLGMLRSSPAPPRLTKQSSFNTLREPYLMSGGLGKAPSAARAPSPSEVDVPIGEQADDKAEKWDGSEVNSVVGDLSSPSGLRRTKAKRYRSSPASPITEDPYEQVRARAVHISKQERYVEDAPSPLQSRYRGRPQSSYVPSTSDWTSTSAPSTPRKEYSVWLPSTDGGSVSESSSGESEDERHTRRPQRPGLHRRTSSVPSLELPTIPKLRKPQPSVSHRVPDKSPPPSIETPRSAPSKLQKKRAEPATTDPKKMEQAPSARPTSVGLRSSILPSFTPAFLKRNRRSSSPLKHEYEPSTASGSLSESELSEVDAVESATSESEEEKEGTSTLGDLQNFQKRGQFRSISHPAPPKSIYSAGGESVRPSDSASQGPYRTVPPVSGQPSKTVASIFAWSDRGSWDSLHPQECSIFVTPGLIEAFDMAQAAAVIANLAEGTRTTPSLHGVKPLVALELTPLVPLRRGTAVDISIRSPPTASSLLRTGNNVMFRSQSPEECEKLYNMINRARIDNPTYIALQNARGPRATSNWAEVMDQRNAQRSKSASWIRLGTRRSSTYRSTGSRAVSASTVATESSIGTTNSAFSALRRFSSGSNGIFNIAKSTLTSREGTGTRSTYSDSLSSGAATPMTFDPSLGTPLGITNAKIRLYIRESASKWRDMGAARLTVMLPPRHDLTAAADPRTTGMDKRIIIYGKSKGETLLDATLGESCFERVARTGIAVSVWEEATGPNGEAVVGAHGGVSNARSKVYMVQMKSERDAAYTFGLVGKLRY